jgi:hypothetical protein
MNKFNLQVRVGERTTGSRQEILEQARLERETRRDAKKRGTSAVTIQRCWRGRRERLQHARQVCFRHV